MLNQGFLYIISLLLGNSPDLETAFIRLGIFALLLLAFQKGTNRIFSESRNAAIVASLVVAALATRLMPLPWVSSMGKLLVVILVLILPYLAVDKLLKKWGAAKILLLLFTYLGLYVLFSGQSLSLAGMYHDIMAYLKYYSWQLLLLLAVIVIYFSARFARHSRKA